MREGTVDAWLEDVMQTAMRTGTAPARSEIRRSARGMAGLDLGNMDRYFDDRRVRDWFIDRYSFAVACREAIEAIAAHGPIVEVGAGTGVWARILSHHVDVLATDVAEGESAYRQRVGAWFPVHQMPAAAAVRSHPGRTVLTVWPSYMDPFAHEAAKAMRRGAVLCYIGEGESGCTADDRFHAYISKRFVEIGTVGIPQFDGLHDHLTILRKKGHPA